MAGEVENKIRAHVAENPPEVLVIGEIGLNHGCPRSRPAIHAWMARQAEDIVPRGQQIPRKVIPGKPGDSRDERANRVHQLSNLVVLAGRQRPHNRNGYSEGTIQTGPRSVNRSGTLINAVSASDLRRHALTDRCIVSKSVRFGDGSGRFDPPSAKARPFYHPERARPALH